MNAAEKEHVTKLLTNRSCAHMTAFDCMACCDRYPICNKICYMESRQVPKYLLDMGMFTEEELLEILL